MLYKSYISASLPHLEADAAHGGVGVHGRRHHGRGVRQDDLQRADIPGGHQAAALLHTGGGIQPANQKRTIPTPATVTSLNGESDKDIAKMLAIVTRF